MKKIPNRLIWGSLLILLGVVFLLQQLEIIGDPLETVVLALLAVGGAAFLFTYFQDADQWWAVIPGLALLGIAFAGFESQFNLLPGDDLGGAVFLGLLGLAFWLVYLRGQVDWWAIIPGGVLVTLALVAGLDDLIAEDGTVFFLGLSATFLLVAVLPAEKENTRWALIPAGALGILGVFLMPGLEGYLNVIWPAVLIVIGLYLIVKNWL
jgi:hypothetical protein